jgi:hypothetical protein
VAQWERSRGSQICKRRNIHLRRAEVRATVSFSAKPEHPVAEVFRKNGKEVSAADIVLLDEHNPEGFEAPVFLALVGVVVRVVAFGLADDRRLPVRGCAHPLALDFEEEMVCVPAVFFESVIEK